MLEHSASVPVTLVNGQRIRIEVTEVTSRSPVDGDVGYSPTGGVTESDVSATFPDFQDISRAIEGIASSLAATIDKISPKKTTVEFGLEITAEAGALTALIVKGSGKANLKVTLEWSK